MPDAPPAEERPGPVSSGSGRLRAFKEWMRGVAIPPGLLPLLPGSSRAFGPPRRRATVVDYFRHNAGSLKEVIPSQTFPQIHCRWVGPEDKSALDEFKPDIPPAYVFSLENARLLGSGGWVIGARDTFLYEASFWRMAQSPAEFRSHWILRRKKPRPLRHLAGRTLSLAADFAVGGYGHFLHDSLPRLQLVEEAGHRASDFDWVYLPHLVTPSTQNLINQLGIPESRLVQFDPAVDLEVEHLVATTFPGRAGHVMPWAADFVRRRFGPAPTSTSGRRLFLSRQGYRRELAGWTEIEPILRKHRFEIVRGDQAKSASLCAEASVVVAQEGANLFNSMFSPPGTKVYVLFPPSKNLPYAFTLAAACGHELWAQGVSPNPKDAQGPITLDLALFQEGLERMLT